MGNRKGAWKNKDKSKYDRPEWEEKSGKAVRSKDVTKDMDEFLGPGETSSTNPFTGEYEPDRIWSADGKRSIRFGDHEMYTNPDMMHFHKESWFDTHVENVYQNILK
jgi:hypothetical protein